ncbi:uncharacterized protein LOC27208825 [Drosophila simulans]|uniref:uncharacterized protein LOC27208825 n=1 Tax=Drosophila simulans TaxID=7240 RepID=UPI00192CF12D|nr:uncharacterized protein LOC27208825 [Drosophila simulans]XP_044778565.1 uncharacterized protein LOC27208825 [Drosophila simulans]
MRSGHVPSLAAGYCQSGILNPVVQFSRKGVVDGVGEGESWERMPHPLPSCPVRRAVQSCAGINFAITRNYSPEKSQQRRTRRWQEQNLIAITALKFLAVHWRSPNEWTHNQALNSGDQSTGQSTTIGAERAQVQEPH